MTMARPLHENKRRRAVLQILWVGFAPDHAMSGLRKRSLPHARKCSFKHDVYPVVGHVRHVDNHVTAPILLPKHPRHTPGTHGMDRSQITRECHEKMLNNILRHTVRSKIHTLHLLVLPKHMQTWGNREHVMNAVVTRNRELLSRSGSQCLTCASSRWGDEGGRPPDRCRILGSLQK